MDDIGTIAPGNQADLVVLDDHPLNDISALRTVKAVYKAGEQFAV